MEQHEFKQMIKQHKVKQAFVLYDWIPGDYYLERIQRFYITTRPPVHLYKNTWTVSKENVLVRSVIEINEDELSAAWGRYKQQCEENRRRKNVTDIEVAYWKQEQKHNIPMHLRPFYKVLIEATEFSLKDQRV